MMRNGYRRGCLILRGIVTRRRYGGISMDFSKRFKCFIYNYDMLVEVPLWAQMVYLNHGDHCFIYPTWLTIEQKGWNNY